MQQYDYKAVPAPRRGEKQRGVKTTEDRFALSVTTVLNELAADGWEYLRAETLPCDERSGFTGTKTTEQNLLIFRRARAVVPARVVAAPQPVAVEVATAAPTVRLGAAKKEKAPAASVAPALGPAKKGESKDTEGKDEA